MPLPKRQHSVQRGRKRRTHWKARVAGFVPCSNCKKPVISHRVCPFCGFYKGKAVVVKVVKEKKDHKQN